tara:strand:+ start:6705 stop:8522 length:1818 start_codon:yes stop_codon:yes gene_type:complete
MCGIAGYIAKQHISKEIIHNTLDLMNNRGPDNKDFLYLPTSNASIGLLHSRLSIIDLDPRSNQPYTFGNYTIIFNGEIYNYIELRKDLEKKGYKFETTSDTEVLIKSFIEYGEECVNTFNGMWAFAIWNKKANKLFLSRDRFGEKPLYYKLDSNGFYFGSEIKFIKSLYSNDLIIDHNQLKRLLVYGYKYIYNSDDTYFQSIKELPFASNAIIDGDLNFDVYSYWEPKVQIQKMSIDDAIEGTKYHLEESMRLRLRADVPMAFCLSGGVDSAALASIAKKIFNYDVTTFSIIDEDERYNEFDNIMLTVNDLDCNHELIYLDNSNMLERLKDLIQYHDAPIATISYLVHSLLSEKIQKMGFKIAISGTAADELFTGYYDHFNLHLYEMRNHTNFQNLLNDWFSNTGKFIRNPYLKNPKLYFEDQTIRAHNHLNSDKFFEYLTDDYSYNIKEREFSDSLLKNRMMNELFYEVTRVILHEDDLNSMRFSIENRSPYLDYNLFNFAFSIPNEHLIKDGYGKYILRQAISGSLNDNVRLDRKKKGFNASIKSIIDLNDPVVIDFLLSESPVFNIIKRKKIESLLKHNNLPNSFNKFLFNFLNVKLFLESN